MSIPDIGQGDLALQHAAITFLPHRGAFFPKRNMLGSCKYKNFYWFLCGCSGDAKIAGSGCAVGALKRINENYIVSNTLSLSTIMKK
ncbi:hypothetical protein [Gibbsiella quercinecans]|uniref:hypothetical protein n=1 Tax=Gibbsiella quercinecans TaxID=929813 RepID=UPI00242B79B4|nr:hypothetical protein [Gibbsiella quercinecans]